MACGPGFAEMYLDTTPMHKVAPVLVGGVLAVHLRADFLGGVARHARQRGKRASRAMTRCATSASAARAAQTRPSRVQ